MGTVANHRLIEAAQALSPADRALLNIWIHHGLDDTALARLTQASPGAIASRRDGIVTDLAATLGLPPEHVRDAIEQIAHSEPVPVAENGSGPPADRPSHAVAHEPIEAPQRRRFTRFAAAALLSIALILVLIVLLSGGSDARRSAGPKPQRSRPAEVVHPQALSELPGAPAGVSGSVAYLGSAPRVRLVVRVSGLPPPGGDHYELWLYNSIIDSLSLGQFSSAAGQLTVSLPPNYRRFRWLDLSRQPVGAAHHSGVSILRRATGP